MLSLSICVFASNSDLSGRLDRIFGCMIGRAPTDTGLRDDDEDDDETETTSGAKADVLCHDHGRQPSLSFFSCESNIEIINKRLYAYHLYIDNDAFATTNTQIKSALFFVNATDI